MGVRCLGRLLLFQGKVIAGGTELSKVRLLLGTTRCEWLYRCSELVFANYTTFVDTPMTYG